MYPALEGDYKAHGYIYPLAGETPNAAYFLPHSFLFMWGRLSRSRPRRTSAAMALRRSNK